MEAAGRTFTPQSRRSLGQRFAAFWILAAFPLSLSSPGATVAMAIVALYGVYIWVRERSLPSDLRGPGAVTLIAWLTLVLVDLADGLRVGNLTTVVDYLPFLALAPLALGIRASGLSIVAIDRAMQVTILVAGAMSLSQALWLGVDRPGGLNLNPIPYAFVVLIWGTLLLSRGLEAGGKDFLSVAAALTAIVPILLSGSKIVWACTAVAYGFVTIAWTIYHRRLKLLLPIVGVGAVILLFTTQMEFVQLRMDLFLVELEEVIATGMSSGTSLGHRLELMRSGSLAFLDKPLFGHGLTDSMAAILSHRNPAGPDISIHNHAHSEYITHLVAYGLFGAVFLAIYYGLLVRLCLTCGVNAYKRGGFAVVVALALYSTVEINFHMDPVSGAMAIFAGLLLAFRGEPSVAPGLVVRETTPRNP